MIGWFKDYIKAINPNYSAYVHACSPPCCDVVFQKSLVTKVVSFLSTLGGLWGPLYMGALLLWLLLAKLPCLAVAGGQKQQQQPDEQVGLDQVVTITEVEVCTCPSFVTGNKVCSAPAGQLGRQSHC
jgi:hypothetical protein